MDVHPHQLLESHWAEFMAPRVLAQRRALPWQMRLTPPFPEAWPPNLLTRFQFYAYAEAPDTPALVDAVRLSQPFARASARLRPPHNALLELLNSQLLPAGVQGFYPVVSPQGMLSTSNSQELLDVWLLALAGPVAHPGVEMGAVTSSIRQHYLLWLKANPLLEPFIRPSHTGFFKWLPAPGRSISR